MMLKARSGFSDTSSASIVPARHASAPAMIHVTRTTSAVLMPETCARSGLSDIARIPLPSRERVRKKWSASTAATTIPTIQTCGSVTEMGRVPPIHAVSMRKMSLGASSKKVRVPVP
jgi:hypothetical protein